MRLRGKLLLVSLTPLLLSLGLIAHVLRQQQQDLAERQEALVRASYTLAAENELRHYTALALSTISPLYNTGRNDPEILLEAKRRLSQLDYGPDGYFFLYNYDGVNLMHPRQPDLVGRNLIDLRDPQGVRVISDMIDKARQGGGFVAYSWNKPSTRVLAPKLAYVTSFERWHWMFGTGIYTDDLERVTSQLERQLNANVDTSVRWIAVAAVGSIVIILLSVLLIGLSELRAADAKLTLLARQVVSTQEEERAWLSRELHDGTSQKLVSAKLLTESALERLTTEGSSQPLLQRALARVNEALTDMRHISHRLRPVALDTLGLSTALRELGAEMCETAGLRFELVAPETSPDLPEVIKTTLFRISQEALINVLRHARASQVRITLERDETHGLTLVVSDDGQGFDSAAVAQHPRRGIGLRNMRERADAIGASFALVSHLQAGTLVRVTVPVDALRRLA
ncbi:cache domain-containing protein [Leptothrix discophora]|uniref:Cache domain-containing protein n=1 Tax=Leptothrix discophora TaxID=89 RepID=A0ABT9G6A5_LEPDI|nr:cache domain-containing protein [Leptothrix discophora]MDP4302016.1 cache domain-containing protein [Leptothrix discophora]